MGKASPVGRGFWAGTQVQKIPVKSNKSQKRIAGKIGYYPLKDIFVASPRPEC